MCWMQDLALWFDDTPPLIQRKKANLNEHQQHKNSKQTDQPENQTT